MLSCRGKPLTAEMKKIVVSVRQYSDREKLEPTVSGTKRTAEALGIGIATVKRIMADYNRDPKILGEPAKTRGHRVYAVSPSYQEAVRTYIRTADKNGEYITLENIRDLVVV